MGSAGLDGNNENSDGVTAAMKAPAPAPAATVKAAVATHRCDIKTRCSTFLIAKHFPIIIRKAFSKALDFFFIIFFLVLAFSRVFFNEFDVSIPFGIYDYHRSSIELILTLGRNLWFTQTLTFRVKLAQKLAVNVFWLAGWRAAAVAAAVCRSFNSQPNKIREPDEKCDVSHNKLIHRIRIILIHEQSNLHFRCSSM